MSHRLQENFEMVTVTFRYACGCERNEVLQIQVNMDGRTFDRKDYFHNLMEAAYLDVQAEIKAHLKKG